MRLQKSNQKVEKERKILTPKRELFVFKSVKSKILGKIFYNKKGGQLFLDFQLEPSLKIKRPSSVCHGNSIL